MIIPLTCDSRITESRNTTVRHGNCRRQRPLSIHCILFHLIYLLYFYLFIFFFLPSAVRFMTYVNGGVRGRRGRNGEWACIREGEMGKGRGKGKGIVKGKEGGGGEGALTVIINSKLLIQQRMMFLFFHPCINHNYV